MNGVTYAWYLYKDDEVKKFSSMTKAAKFLGIKPVTLHHNHLAGSNSRGWRSEKRLVVWTAHRDGKLVYATKTREKMAELLGVVDANITDAYAKKRLIKKEYEIGRWVTTHTDVDEGD